MEAGEWLRRADTGELCSVWRSREYCSVGAGEWGRRADTSAGSTSSSSQRPWVSRWGFGMSGLGTAVLLQGGVACQGGSSPGSDGPSLSESSKSDEEL